jgi:hypothetical protein
MPGPAPPPTGAGLRRLLALVVVGLVVLGACSDEEPPSWLQDLAVEAAMTTTAPTPTTTIPAVTTTVARGDETAALDLVEGTCLVDADFAEGEPTQVTELTTIRCREPHQAEIYEVIQLRPGRAAPFPGGDELRRDARRRCRARFEAFVGVPWTASELEFATLQPTRASWAEGDRAIVCALFRPDGRNMDGSARNARF